MIQIIDILSYDFCIKLFKLGDLDYTLPCVSLIISGQLDQYVLEVSLDIGHEGRY